MFRLKFALIVLILAGTAWLQTPASHAYEDPIIGQDFAPLEMEVFTDYQCPFCARFHETLLSDAIMQNYINTGLLRITLKDFPLTSIHKNAKNAAKAVNSIHVIDSTMAYNFIDAVYENQSEWGQTTDPQEYFFSLAQEVASAWGEAISKNEFIKYYVDSGNSAEIAADMDKGSTSVTGTPTYVINGKQYSGASSLETLIEHLELALTNHAQNTGDQDFSVFSAYNDVSGLIEVYWDSYPFGNVKYYKIKVSSADLINNDFPDERNILPHPTIKHYDVFNTEYFFRAEKSRYYLIVIEAYDQGETLLDSISTQIDTLPQRFDCPQYEVPECPNGTVIYPPAADGCPGPPYCNTAKLFDETPKAGYEDEVRVRFEAEENPFTDMNIESLEGSAAAELFFRGVIGGFPDGEFKGDRPVNRAEAAKFLLLARNAIIPERVSRNPFRDVISEEWYAPFVVEASKLGIIFGYQDSTFRPANGVQTDEFLAMLSRTFDLPTGLSHNYLDEAEMPGQWFWEYAGIAQKYDLFPNRGNRLNPAQALTRNEVAIAIYQYLKNR